MKDCYLQPSPIIQNSKAPKQLDFIINLFALGYKQLLLMLYTTFLWFHGKLTWLVFPIELISYQPIRYWIFLPFRGSVYYVSHKQTILVSCNILQLPHQRKLRFRSLNFTIKKIEINKSILLSFSLDFGGFLIASQKVSQQVDQTICTELIYIHNFVNNLIFNVLFHILYIYYNKNF